MPNKKIILYGDRLHAGMKHAITAWCIAVALLSLTIWAMICLLY